MRDSSREFGLKNGHSPLAEKVVLVDFDGTIFPFGELWSMDPPMPGAKKVLDYLHEHGWTIKIFSSRLSLLWCQTEGESMRKHAEYMSNRLEMHNIHYSCFSIDKDPAEYYIDDKAIPFNGNWDLVLDQIKWDQSRKDRNGR